MKILVCSFLCFSNIYKIYKINMLDILSIIFIQKFLFYFICTKYKCSKFVSFMYKNYIKIFSIIKKDSKISLSNISWNIYDCNTFFLRNKETKICLKHKILYLCLESAYVYKFLQKILCNFISYYEFSWYL